MNLLNLLSTLRGLTYLSYKALLICKSVLREAAGLDLSFVMTERGLFLSHEKSFVSRFMVEMMLELCFLGLAAAVFTCWEGQGTAEVQGIFGCQPNTEVLFLSVLHQSGGCSWMSSSLIAVKCQNAMNDKKFWFCITRCPADIEVETYYFEDHCSCKCLQWRCSIYQISVKSILQSAIAILVP